MVGTVLNAYYVFLLANVQYTYEKFIKIYMFDEASSKKSSHTSLMQVSIHYV